MHASPASEHYVTSFRSNDEGRIRWHVYRVGADGRTPVMVGVPYDHHSDALAEAKRLDKLAPYVAPVQE